MLKHRMQSVTRLLSTFERHNPNMLNLRTYKKTFHLHSGTREGGWLQSPHWGLTVLQYFEDILPVIDSLWCALTRWGKYCEWWRCWGSVTSSKMVFNSDFTENSYLPEKYGNFKQFSLYNILLRLVAFYMFFFSETKGKTNTIIVLKDNWTATKDFLLSYFKNLQLAMTVLKGLLRRYKNKYSDLTYVALPEQSLCTMLIFLDSGLTSPRPSNPTPIKLAPSIWFYKFKLTYMTIQFMFILKTASDYNQLSLHIRYG